MKSVLPHRIVIAPYLCYKSEPINFVKEINWCLYLDRGKLLVAQLVEALRYKPEDRGFDSRWCHWIFFH
jgi:hypothetical protein